MLYVEEVGIRSSTSSTTSILYHKTSEKKWPLVLPWNWSLEQVGSKPLFLNCVLLGSTNTCLLCYPQPLEFTTPSLKNTALNESNNNMIHISYVTSKVRLISRYDSPFLYNLCLCLLPDSIITLKFWRGVSLWFEISST